MPMRERNPQYLLRLKHAKQSTVRLRVDGPVPALRCLRTRLYLRVQRLAGASYEDVYVDLHI